LCGTTEVVSNRPDDTELGLLLAQLLRLVSPAAGDSTAGSALGDDAPRYAPASSDAAGNGSHATRSAVTEPAADYSAVNDRAGNDGPASDSGASDGAASDGAATSRAAAAGIPQVSGSEARALIELVKARGIAQGELAGLLGLEKSTVSRLAAGLERKGWIRRGRDEGNQRYVRLYLTAEGGVVATRLWDAWQSRQARILAALSAEERAGLSAGLRGLVRGLAAEGLLTHRPSG